MAVDNLPCELPRSSSEEFGKDLIDKILKPLFQVDPEAIIERATIARKGENSPIPFDLTHTWTARAETKKKGRCRGKTNFNQRLFLPAMSRNKYEPRKFPWTSKIVFRPPFLHYTIAGNGPSIIFAKKAVC